MARRLHHGERARVEAMAQAGISAVQIAERLGRHRAARPKALKLAADPDQAAAVCERFAKECQPPKNVAIAYLSHSLSHTWVGLPVRSTRRAQPTGASALLLARGAAPSATPRQNRMSTMA